MAKRYYFALLLLFAITTSVHAQEFKVDLHVKDGSGFGLTGTFGFDPMATDGYDSQFGEHGLYPPPGPGLDFRFVGNVTGQNINDGDGDPVNIRRKPNTDSFTIQYEWSLAATDLPVTVTWSSITNPNIKAITLAPAALPSLIIGDLTKKNSITITSDSLALYRDVVLTVYYNMLPSSSVRTVVASSANADLKVWPNPLTSSSKISFTSRKDEMVVLRAVDVAGRELWSSRVHAKAGENTINSETLRNVTSKAMYLQLRTSDGMESLLLINH